MKELTTMKAVKARFPHVIQIPCRALQRLLFFSKPYAYTQGVYGWNADVYAFGNCAIVTGYRTFGNVTPERDLWVKYEMKGYEICADYHDITPETEPLASEALNLVHEFIEEALKEVK